MDIISIREIVTKIAAEDQCSDRYNALVKTLKELISPRLGQLEQLIKTGPVEDGDIISKSERDDLLNWGLATRVCCKGEQGYTAATYRGWNVFYADKY